MKRASLLAAALVCCLVCPAQADYGVWNEGVWPADWPKELDPIRKQARTLEGPLELYRFYQIPFTKRAEFEAAWPHLLKVKSKGAPIILIKAPKTDFFAVEPAGVLIHTPPIDADKVANPDKPIAGAGDARSRWLNATYIELVVDGDIVNLNRIELPADTPIVDERFKEKPKK